MTMKKVWHAQILKTGRGQYMSVLQKDVEEVIDKMPKVVGRDPCRADIYFSEIERGL